MTKILLTVFIITLTIGMYAQTASESTVIDNSPRWVLKVSPLGLKTYGRYTNTYYYAIAGEFCFKNRHSLQLSLQPGFYNKTYFTGVKVKTNSLSFYPAYKFYCGKRPYSGFYLGPSAVIGVNKSTTITPIQSTNTEYYYKYNSSFWGMGCLFGYQRNITDKWLIDIGTIAHLEKGKYTLIETNNPKPYIYEYGRARGSLNLIFMVNIGYRF